MAQELTEYLEGRSVSRFASVPHYFRDGDFVTFYVSDERYYAERVDQLLTVYRSATTGAMIGCKIKGVRHILSTLGDFAVVVRDGAIQLGLFFLAAALDIDPSKRRFYHEVARLAKDLCIAPDELPVMAA
ncbi:MAG: hypothetical protein KKA28_07600 [Planctomycetes bacterium]|nr:hypothetical protein [Planctomycetota bacterium]MCG2685442.1 hypothetical protein [Planctomycetales bacterium]